MEIKGLQKVKVEVSNYDMKGYVEEWLRNSIGLGEHDYIHISLAGAQFVRRDDISTHRTEYEEIERRPATDAEIHVWQVLQDIKAQRIQ